MSWDVFISYAREDQRFAKALAKCLVDMGLQVWFDEFELTPGASLRALIDRGLSQSRFGCVILSKAFFSKDWPQRELAGLLARESQDFNVIIPIWYDVEVNDIKQYSPILADKVSLLHSGGTDSFAIEHLSQKIMQVVYRDKLKSGGWQVAYVAPVDDISIALLPIHPRHGVAIGIGRYPITNAQYRKFIQETGHRAPIGEHFADGIWAGPFLPQEHTEFSQPDQPIVCVDFDDSLAYCRWLTKRFAEAGNPKGAAFIPDRSLWLIAATGQRPSLEMLEYKATIFASKFVHKSGSPALVNDDRNETSKIGVTGLVGNIWEWCMGEYYYDLELPSLTDTGLRYCCEVRGGSFNEDLSQAKLQLRDSLLTDGKYTRHSDLGFRVGLLIPLHYLSEAIRLQLLAAPRYPRTLWHYLDQDFHYAYRRDIYLS